MSDSRLRFLPFVLLFSLIASCIEIDVSLPGFPEMARFFDVSEAKIQGTLSINFLGFCAACLFFGPLSDSFGRKKMMSIGFFLFCIGSLGCAVTDSYWFLMACRFVQGLGASSVWVVTFAIIADAYKGNDAVKFIGIMNSVITGVMAVAPILGAVICDYLGWRATYGFIAILSCLSFVSITGFLPETNMNRKEFSARSVLKDYFILLKDYNFMIHCLAPSILVSAYMAYVGTASFLYRDHLNMSFAGYAFHQFLVVATFSILSFKTGAIQAALGYNKTIKWGLGFCCVGALTIIPVSKIYCDTAYSITIPMMFYSCGVALCYGVIFTKSMEIFPDLKGASSALIMGFRVVLCSIGVITTGIAFTGFLYHTAIAISCLAFIGILFTILVLEKRNNLT